MSRDRNDEINLERRQELRDDEEAFRLHQEEGRLQAAKQSTAYVWILNSIVWLTGALEMLLSLRLILRLFGANRENQFAQWINDLSAPFVAPFATLFLNPTAGGGTNVFDINIAIALVAYAFASYLVITLIKLMFNRRL
jgi:YggT family protein